MISFASKSGSTTLFFAFTIGSNVSNSSTVEIVVRATNVFSVALSFERYE